MEENHMNKSKVIHFNLNDGLSPDRESKKRMLSDMVNMYLDNDALITMIKNEDVLVYEFYELGLPETSGHIAYGTTILYPGKVGNELLRKQPKKWKTQLNKLSSIDWSRSNSEFWEGRALVIGRVSKANQSVALTTNILKKHLGMKLKPEEQEIEDAFLRGDDV